MLRLLARAKRNPISRVKNTSTINAHCKLGKSVVSAIENRPLVITSWGENTRKSYALFMHVFVNACSE